MLTFLFLAGLSATILLLMAVAADSVVERARGQRSAPAQVTTGALVDISLARAGVVRGVKGPDVRAREERQAA